MREGGDRSSATSFLLLTPHPSLLTTNNRRRGGCKFIIKNFQDGGHTIRAIATFLCLLIATLFTGALLAYPLYLLPGIYGRLEFNAVVMHATQICGLVFALVYLARVRPLSRQSLGLAPAGGHGLTRFLAAFAWGAVILGCLIAILLALGIYHQVPGRDTGPAAVLVLCIKAVLTGLAVGLFEETVFRGAILGGLAQRTAPAVALVTISLLYAAVHFIHYPATADPGWLSAARQFSGAYLAIFNPAQLNAFLALFVLGLLLGLMRLRSGDIIACIGLHAGLVTMVKISRYFYHYTGGTPFDFLVSVHDRRLGYLALLLLCVAATAYNLRTKSILDTTFR